MGWFYYTSPGRYKSNRIRIKFSICERVPIKKKLKGFHFAPMRSHRKHSNFRGSFQNPNISDIYIVYRTRSSSPLIRPSNFFRRGILFAKVNSPESEINSNRLIVSGGEGGNGHFRIKRRITNTLCGIYTSIYGLTFYLTIRVYQHLLEGEHR